MSFSLSLFVIYVYFMSHTSIGFNMEANETPRILFQGMGVASRSVICALSLLVTWRHENQPNGFRCYREFNHETIADFSHGT